MSTENNLTLGDKKSLIEILSEKYLGVTADQYNDEKYLDYLETVLEKANEAARNGEELMPDSIYDAAMDLLRELNPDSPILHQVWSGDAETVAFDKDIDQYLAKCPMMSIQTVKDLKDKCVQDFIDRLPSGTVNGIASVKENGHGIRIVYVGKDLIKATSRGRSTNGRDLTRQMQLILGSTCDSLEDDKIYEFRGEVLLPFSNLDKAKEYKSDIKSAFTGVSSMLRDSATDEETKLLRFVAYDIITDDLTFTTLSEKFTWLESHGFTTPVWAKFSFTKENAVEVMEACVNAFTGRTANYDFYTDGVVFGVDNLEVFNNMGSTDKYRYGNLALKIGRWKQDLYVGLIKGIKWVHGKSKLTPVAQVCDPDDPDVGVMTATGNTVVNVPLYAPCYILMLEAYKGNLIHFKYGGEAGVIPCLPSGQLVTDKDAVRPLGYAGADDVDVVDYDEDPFEYDLDDDDDAISY